MIAILAVVTGLGSLLLALRRRSSSLRSWLSVAFLVVLAAWPEVNALAAIGPHPDGGGRSTASRMRSRRFCSRLTRRCGCSRRCRGHGDRAPAARSRRLEPRRRRRGGLLVVTAAFAVLLARLTRVRLTPARLVLGVAGVLAVGLAIVGLDALLGGSSHVTDAVGAVRHAARRSRPASPDLAGRSDVRRPHGVPLRPVDRRSRVARHPWPEATGDRCHARRDRRLAARQRYARRRARLRRARMPGAHRLAKARSLEIQSGQPLSERTEASSRPPEPQEHPAR